MPRHLRVLDTPPLSLGELRRAIATRQVTFSHHVESVARTVLAEPELMAFESAPRIAKRIGVSTSTVIRFVTHIGFRNFGQARGIFQAELRRRLISIKTGQDTPNLSDVSEYVPGGHR